MPTATPPDAPEAARTHRARLLTTARVQYPDAVAERGFRLLHPATGDRYTGARRHLVATCRSVATFSLVALADGPEWARPAATHGLAFLDEAHGRADGGYDLVVTADGDPVDRTKSAYGHAFVLLAYARAVDAGIDGAREGVASTHALIEDRFRDARGLLRSDCDAEWAELEPYRGQNADMHACEAYLAAYEATGEDRYLDRARHVAAAITVELAAETDGLVWEHYTPAWAHDFGYNGDEPRHQFRPPGFQPGHHAEWAKFLALLDRYDAARPPDAPSLPGGGDGDVDWYERGLALFDAAVEHGWAGDGFIYTHAADGSPTVEDRYGWALAEALGAAAALAERAAARGDVDAAVRLDRWHRRFLAETDRFRGPAGVWYEKRLPPADGDGDGAPVAPEPPGVEPDYHPAGAFFESWRSARRRS